ncbi:hypothetical protein [Bradyrhizobium elkanii]|uniref:Uncharacterized protein n=1 Tax=Bradyrhizobium diazoefficiens TaxID=1355477 RepID=A0A810CSF3_9BRAD|nr:hypothetical protein XF1B_49120 [Bradyrhizobium diazoefficiens]BCE48496.1 hypothetical protein XF4B_48450 [Bradyrhizobium diazoefficiens]BCE92012.1 hypothetical protein XF10B_48100 [Bradyrhizobium diazoefficiens]BCF26940.1 hypothetical protein XF14B_48920 [Bradyrhizobium diazoefficiens]
MSQTNINTAQIDAGPVAYQVQRQDDGTVTHKIRIRTTGESVVADLTEEQARFFFNRGQQVVGSFDAPEDLWTKLPTYAAVEADRQRIAARNAAV